MANVFRLRSFEVPQRQLMCGVLLGIGLGGCSGGGGSAALPAPVTLAAVPASATAKPNVQAPAAAVTAAPATPTPAPPVAVVASPSATQPPAAPLASAAYPIYSSYFTGKTPFHDTVAQLMGAGATIRPSIVAQNFWNEGIGNNRPYNVDSPVSPFYMVRPGDPGYVFSCAAYGTCNANGMVVHFPQGAVAATGGDHHLTSFDPVYLHGEVDGWGGYGPNCTNTLAPTNSCPHPCNLSSPSGGSAGTANCSWGGVFPFSGDGLATSASSGNAAGYASGLTNVSAQELLNGHIDHALAIVGSCLDDGGVYPSAPGRTTDSRCPANAEPNARYGDLIHLKANVDVASLGYGSYCQTVVRALQTYGAYTSDTNGSWGVNVNFEYPSNPAYTTDPWNTIIYPAMAAAGDGSGSGGAFSFQTCMQRIPANDIEVIAISTTLP